MGIFSNIRNRFRRPRLSRDDLYLWLQGNVDIEATASDEGESGKHFQLDMYVDDRWVCDGHICVMKKGVYHTPETLLEDGLVKDDFCMELAYDTKPWERAMIELNFGVVD